MIIEKWNNENKQYFLFDTEVKKWETKKGNWVDRIKYNPSRMGEAIGKNITKVNSEDFIYYKFDNHTFHSLPEMNMRISYFLSNIIKRYYSKYRIWQSKQDFNAFDKMFDDQYQNILDSFIADQIYIHVSVVEVRRVLGDEENKQYVNIDMEGYECKKQCVQLVKDGYLLHDIKRVNCNTGGGKTRWQDVSVFSPTKKLLSLEYHQEYISYKRIVNGLDSLYEYKLNELDDVSKKVFKTIANITFNITIDKYKELVNNNYHTYYTNKVKEILLSKHENLNEYKRKSVELKRENTRNKYKQKYESLLRKEPLSKERYLQSMLPYFEEMKSWNGSSFKQKIDFVKVDFFGNRLHSPFTRIPSFVREYLFDSKGWNELDCNTFQLSLLAQLIKNEGVTSEIETIINSGKDIYEDYSEKLGLANRKLAKTECFHSIFSGVNSPALKRFKRVYPVSGKMIDVIKRKNYTKNAASYKSLCQLTQRLESKIFRVLWDFMADANIKFFTVHDSVVFVGKDNVKKVGDRLQEILKELVPDVKVLVH